MMRETREAATRRLRSFDAMNFVRVSFPDHPAVSPAAAEVVIG